MPLTPNPDPNPNPNPDPNQVDKWVGGKELKKFVYVPGRIVNIVIGK